MINSIKERNRFVLYILPLLAFSCMPPVLACLFSLFLFVRKQQKVWGIFSLMFFVLILSYNFYSIDNCSRYENTKLELIELIPSGDYLTILAKWLISTFNVQFSFVIYLYVLAAYLMLCISLNRVWNKKWTLAVVSLVVSTMSLRYSLDLLYYTLAVNLALIFLSKQNLSKYKFLLLIALVYFIHPGFLMVLLPSVLISYTYNKGTKLYIFSLLIIFCTTYLLSKVTLPATGIQMLDLLVGQFNDYMDPDNYWGKRSASSSLTSGLSYILIYIILPLFYFILFTLTVRYRNVIKSKRIIALFQSALIFYPNFISYNTMTERILLVMSILSVFVMIILNKVGVKFLRLQYIACLCSILFLFNAYKASGAVYLHNVFKDDSYQSIRNRSYYAPSIMLMSFRQFGYSNEFLDKNIEIKY